MKKAITWIVAVLLMVCGATALNADQYLWGHFQFENSTNESWNSAGTGWGFTETGTVTNTSGKYGSGANFPGSNDWYETNKYVKLGDNSTIAMWHKPTSFTGAPYLYTRTGANTYYTYFGATGYQIHGGSGAANINFGTSLNQWMHIAVTNDNGILNLYANGTYKGQLTGQPTGDLSVIARLGAAYDGTNDYYGVRDEIVFWNRSLNSTEIADLYANGITYPEQNLTVSAINSYSGASVLVFNVTLSNASISWHFNTTNGTVQTNVSSGEYNITVTSEGYETNHTYNQDATEALIVYLEPYASASLTYDEEIIEYQTITLTLRVNLSENVTDWTAALTWNGTSKTVTETNYTGYVVYSSTFDVPVQTTVPTNITFLWEYNVTVGGTDYEYNVSANQTIVISGVQVCSAGDPLEIFRFFIYDEDDQIALNASLAMLFSRAGVSDPPEYNISVSGNSSYSICAKGNSSMSVDAYITNTYAFTHRYYMINETVVPGTPRNISLYNFNQTTGISDLKLTVRNEDNYQIMSGIVGKLQRLYVGEGVWRTVQMDRTGDYGQLFYNIHEENTDYRIIFIDSTNHTLHTTESMKFVCTAGVCELIMLLNEFESGTTSDNLSVSWSYNNVTGVLTISWDDPVGRTTSVTSKVTRETGSGSTTICTETTSGSTGSQTCNITGVTGTIRVHVQSSTEGVTGYEIDEWLQVQPTSLMSLVGVKEGTLWAIGFMVTIIMFGVTISPVAAVITTVLSLVVVFFLGILTPVTVTFIIIAAVLGIAIGIKVRS